MRSPAGVSAELLRAARRGVVTLTATVSLCLEYEAVCSRPEHVQAAGLRQRDVDVFLEAVISMVSPAGNWFLWRPQLRDPGDELVLEAAVNGRADCLVTFNRRDFRKVAERFGINVLLPSDALRRLR